MYLRIETAGLSLKGVFKKDTSMDKLDIEFFFFEFLNNDAESSRIFYSMGRY